MMNNNNNFGTRYNPMSSSSMFSNTSNNQFKKFTPYGQTAPYDPFQRSRDNNYEQPNTQFFPRAMASQSMIAINTSSSSTRPTFGKLDSMARKVTTTFQDDPSHEANKKPENPFAFSDNSTQSMSSNSQNNDKPHYGFGKLQDMKKMSTEPSQPAPKKRRQSIDLGIAGRSDSYHDGNLPFLRRGPQIDIKNQKQTVNSEADSPGLQALKNKNFEFLRKRKQPNGSQTTHSMMFTQSQGVQSMKNLQTYNLTNMKKSEFLSPLSKPNYNNDVKCPQQKGKYETPLKMDHPSPVSPVSPNFQFKKKKAFEAPIQIASSKPMMKQQSSKEIITAKDRRNARAQRQIKLSDFELLQKLGKGAFGDVYMAQQKALGFICVIKKMSKKRIRQLKVQNHVLRQIKIQSYLNHSNLTGLFGYFHDEQNLYLIIQALPDGSLMQIKKKKKLPEKQTTAIIKQVCEGLKYMHEEFIIHRDLKPQNLFVNDGVIKLGDFGCSIYNQDSGLRTTVVGSLQYSSPQQLSKQAYSQKIDSWSLGILTYQLLFGKSPFQKDIMNIAKNRQIQPKLSNLVFPPSIPIKDQTKDFIQKLLAQDPDRRIDIDEALYHDFLKEQMSKKPVKLQLL